ncbi:aldo/keto reductase [Alteromonas sp. ASW11-36]|uniref:Aldo/keto reductase n=1 Tax=Alteromonas arenosi TaxID=3055817 RepID=A0ABT7SS31_9ALTE|nr:aldo/keto reductase [Alteromonas sp. ASW11-36]MDM7859008.1 aldo/keto reductase [Alteromonas sp. ASW11-36]
MQKNNIPLTSQYSQASQLVYGCMGLGGSWNANPISAADIAQAQDVTETALECGITVFDHADIYTLNKAEQVFGEVLKNQPQLRERMVIQSKCAIRFADEYGPKRYDFSAAWIGESVENILRRLHIEQLDILLLHRPDPLMELDETSTVLNQLTASGKVAEIGVSNMHSGQIALLQSQLDKPIVANQIEMSLVQFDWLEEGMTTGSSLARENSFDSHLLSYCQLNNVQLQAWGSLAQGKVTDLSRAQTPQEQRIAAAVAAMAAEYQTSAEAIALAWLMRLPMGIQPIIGTTNPDRIRACAQASSLTLSREHWYTLLEAARGADVP